MREFKSALVQNKRLLPGIHGLRGVAALAIVLYHMIHIGGVEPPKVFAFIGRDFGYSVHLFFILSAYSLMHSTEPRINRPDWLVNYVIKRFFRIAPLFYVMVVWFVVHGFFSAGILSDFTNLILNLTLTFGFVPATGIVWGGWSVGVEVIFYTIFPVLLLLIKSHKGACVFLIFSVVVTCALRSALQVQFVGLDPLARFDWSYFSFAANICFFAMGMYAYLLCKFYKNSMKLLNICVPISATLIICGLLFSDLGAALHNSSRFDLILFGIGLTALTIWQAHRPSFSIANHIFEYLGERSYSIYLVHPVIIYQSKTYISETYRIFSAVLGNFSYFVCAGILMAILLVVVEFTYRVIEVPGIRMGQRLISTTR